VSARRRNISFVVLPLLTALAGVVCDRAGATEPAGEYRIQPGASELRVFVYRGGLFSALGHNHVISSTQLTGSVRIGPVPEMTRLEIALPLESLAVDLPGQRREAGGDFAGELDENQRAGTRRNMLGPELLDAASHPYLRLSGEGIRVTPDGLLVTVLLEIAGRQSELELPAAYRVNNDMLIATGASSVLHSDLGLEPFRVAFGTLRVRDRIEFSYRIVAHPVTRAGGRKSSSPSP